MEHTKEQLAIFDCIENSENHLIVNAGAGTGKTTTIVEAANRLPNGVKAAFLAFNKPIAEELGEKLPSNMEARTFHSFGFAAIRNAGVRTKYNGYKVNNIIKDLLGSDFHVAPLKRLVSLIKGSRIEYKNNISGIISIMDEYNIRFNSDREERIAIENIPKIMEVCKAQTNIIDFDDMIWLPLVNNYPFPKYDVLFVDDAQDFNEAQREMLSRCVNNGRFVIVGDKNQAIYGFRGADSNSINLFYQRLLESDREVVQLPLSITWRCPKSVVKEANRYVKEFSAPDFAIQGTVVENASFNPQEGDMVLCRYNAPLIGAFYDLISQGKSAYILGKDMTSGLINAVKKISSNNQMGVEEFETLFMTDFSYNYQRLINSNKENQAIALEDKKDCIMIFVKKATTVGGIIEEIKRVFDGNEEGEIMLSTVHKAKGLEADNVYILATNRMPHPLGGLEENHICYVAITRAKKNLFYVGPKPQKVGE